MTDTEIDNAKLAVLLGWKLIPPDRKWHWTLRRPDGVRVHPKDAPDFATNLDAAMSLVGPACKKYQEEEKGLMGFHLYYTVLPMMGARCRAMFSRPGSPGKKYRVWSGKGNTPAAAITAAVQKLVNENPQAAARGREET